MRNIKVSKIYTPLTEMLQGPGRQFKHMRDFYLFAANLGYTLKISAQPVEPTDIFDSRLLIDNDFIKNSMLSLALAEKNDKAFLLEENQETVANIFESYLEGGLDVLKQYMDRNASDLDGNTTLIKLFQDKSIIKIEDNLTTDTKIEF